jgi:tetratricopeptide (TPR) repeat protein
VYESLVGQKEAARNSNSVDPDIISSLESLEIWQDTLPITEKGTRIGVVKNEVDAPELANRLGAQVLIYGNIDPQGNFTPRFYVSPLVHSGTDQIIGHYSLGNTPVPINSTALDFAINKVADRTDPLLWLAVGLRQEQLGFAPEALDAFGRAVNAVEDQEGADIIYYFSGDAALFLAQQQTGFNEDLASRSEDAFTEALQINPQSFRAHVGIAAVNLYRAKNEHHLNLEASKPFLDKAIQESQLALQLTSSSPDQELKVLATLALAQTQYFLGAANYQVRRFEEAEAAFNQAIQMLEGISPELAGGSAPRITGLVYQTMGTVYKQMAQIYEITGENEQSLDFYRQARDAYALCIEQGKAGVFDEILTGTIIRKFCVPQDAESAKAMQLLQGGQ